MPSTFRMRLTEAMQIRDMSQADLAKAAGLSKPRISQYVNGTYEAKQQALYALAKALRVNILWLMGNDVAMESDDNTLHQEIDAIELIEKTYGKAASSLIQLYLKMDEIDQQKFMEVLSMYSKLDAYDKGSIIERMRILLEQEKYFPSVHF